jgi:hypothetical protein
MEAAARELSTTAAEKGGPSMRKTLFMLGLAGLMAAGLLTLQADEASALVWRDCQRIAMCSGCRPVYKCRSCSYKRTCAGGICGWGDVCVWGPYVKVLPRGARIIR